MALNSSKIDKIESIRSWGTVFCSGHILHKFDKDLKTQILPTGIYN